VELIRDWAALRTVQNRAAEVQHVVVMNRWNKPLTGRIKCNIDAFFTKDKVDIVMCLIDASCAFVIAKRKWFSSSSVVLVWS
jgi:hypothetical protein